MIIGPPIIIIIIIISNKHDNVYRAVITQSHCESPSGSFDKWRLAS